MKVFIVPSWYPTDINLISGIFFKEQALALQKSGLDVTVLYPEIRSLKKIGKFNSTSGFNFELESELKTYRKVGYNYLPRVKNHVRKTYLNWLEILFNKAVIEQGLPDVIHAHSIIWGGWAAAQIATKHNIPLVITEHSSSFTRNLILESQKRYIVEALEVADEIIGVGPSLKDELQKYTKHEVRIIPNIVDITMFHINQFGTSNEKFRFFSLALLTKNKGMDILLNSFAKAFSHMNNVELVIGGDGQEEEKLKRLCKVLKIDDKVHFIGRLAREQVCLEMNKCDSFVLASRSETFGVVYIEALACGKPVVATKCGGPDFIVNSNNGLLVEVDDLQGLAEALKDMKSNYNRYEPAKIIEDCKNRFSEEAVIKQLINIYVEVIKNKKNLLI